MDTELCQKLNDHIKKCDELLEKLDPVVDALDAINAGRRFIIWFGTLLITMGGIMAFFKGWFDR